MAAVAQPKKLSELNEEMACWYDEQPMRVSCGLGECSWSWYGPSAEGRRLAAEHRADGHPEWKPSKKALHRTLAQQVKERDARRLASAKAGGAVAAEKAASRQREPEPAAPLEELAHESPPEPLTAPLSPERPSKPRWAYDGALQALQALSERLGHAPSHTDIENAPEVPSSGTITKLFGSLTALNALLGFEPRGVGRPKADPSEPKRRWTRWTRELAIERAQEAAARIGRTPMQREASALELPSSSTARELFPNWNAYMEAAGLQPNENGARPNGAVLGHVERVEETEVGIVDEEVVEVVARALVNTVVPEENAREAAVKKIVEGVLELIDATLEAA